MKTLQFDYYYGAEADQFTFLRIPRVLITEPHFKRLSMESKVLYGLMLDRMGLSMKNEWLDEHNRVYIYFTLEDIQECLSCGHNKGVKLLAELDTTTGIGLIERVKQGQGKPTRIYVKNFNVEPNTEIPVSRTPDFPKEEVQTSQNRKSRLPQSGSADFRKKDTNYTDINKTDSNDTEYQSIYQRQRSEKQNPIDRIDTINAYSEIIKENISYDYLCKQDKTRAYEIHELFEIMLEAVCSTRDTIRVGREDMPTEIVKSRLLKLDYSHIEYVMDSMDKTTTDVRDIRSYLLTALYRSPTTISNKYKAEVNHDMYTAQPPK